MTKKMSSLTQTTTKKSKALEPHRIIGSIKGSEEGPTIIILAGMHGNEPSGVKALEGVFDMLEAAGTSFHGRFIGIRANLSALQRTVRYVDEDMNRIWFPSIIKQIRNTPKEDLASSERREIKQVLKVMDRLIFESGDKPLILADIHSFSAEGCMFAITAPKKRHTDLLKSLHVPMIFGIENTLRGTALRYYQDRGHLTFALEGGQHENELTVYNVTAALMVLLAETGFVKAIPDGRIHEFGNHLKEYTRHVPDRVELVYQHIIEEGDDFSMRPGFTNFQQVKEGEWLANDKEGKIRAQCDGYIVMPLYQDQGNDGFFIVHEQA